MPALNDALKLGLGITTAATAASLAVPESAESATLPLAAIKHFSNLWRKNNIGKVLTSSQEGNINNWAKVNIPKALNAATPATDLSDLKLLTAMAKHSDFPNIPAENINTLRRSQAAIPEQFHYLAQPDIAALENASPTLSGQARIKGNKSTISYNPLSTEDLSQTPGHEFTGHLGTYDRNIKTIIPPEVNKELALTRAIDFASAKQIAASKLANEVQSAIEAKTGKGISSKVQAKANSLEYGIYFGKPGEQVARATGEETANAVASKDLSKVRDAQYTISSLHDKAKKANALSQTINPDAYNWGLKNRDAFLSTLAATGAVGAVASQPGEASTDTSNIDKTVKSTSRIKDGNGNGNENENLSYSRAKNEVRKVIEGAKTVGGILKEGVGRPLWETAKSLKRIASGGRGIGDSGIGLEDYGNAAMAFFVPGGKVGMGLVGAAGDVFSPVGVNEGEPDPARFK